MRGIWLALCAACCIGEVAGAAPLQAEVGERVIEADALPRRHLSLERGVIAQPNQVYAMIPGYRPLTLDLYRQESGPARPLVIYVHGGGWMGGTSRNAAAFVNFPAVLADLASRGYVVASLNYRLGGEARFPAATQDVDAAIRWLKSRASDFGIDKSRVAIWGGSAGGQLAALGAVDCTPAAAGAESDCVQAAAIWYGVFHVPALANGGPPYLSGHAVAASATTFVDARDPPFLLLHGNADRTVPVEQSRIMAARLKAAGVSTDVIELPGIDHSWIGDTPAETRAAHLRALQATFDFFDATVGAGR